MDRIAKLSEEERDLLASEYKLLIENIGIHEEEKNIFKINDELSKRGIEMSARNFRKICEDIMYLFIYGKMDFIVVGNKNGYKATNKEEDYEAFLRKKHQQFISLSSNYYKLKRTLETSKNMHFNFEEEMSYE
jgi:hypothetical protein